MDIFTEGAQTPPHQVQYKIGILTPPLTERGQKRVQFLESDCSKSQKKRFSSNREVKATLMDREKTLTRNSENDLSDVSIAGVLEPKPIKNYTHPIHTAKLNNDNEVTTFTSTLVISALPGRIEFMRLPPSIRKKIYHLLLTVPAIICLRQNRSPYEHIPAPWCNITEVRLLAGLAFVATQHTSNGLKSRMQHHQYTNVAILCANRKVHKEAKEILYGHNTFELANLTNETSPPADFNIPLLPRSCSYFVASLCIRGASIYALRFMVKDGHTGLKNTYRSLKSLLLILEIESLRKGYGKKLTRKPKENWMLYIKRLMSFMALELFDCVGIMKKIPAWISLKVMFEGDEYIDSFDSRRDSSKGEIEKVGLRMNTGLGNEDIEKQDLKLGVSEAFELFKKGHR